MATLGRQRVKMSSVLSLSPSCIFIVQTSSLVFVAASVTAAPYSSESNNKHTIQLGAESINGHLSRHFHLYVCRNVRSCCDQKVPRTHTLGPSFTTSGLLTRFSGARRQSLCGLLGWVWVYVHACQGLLLDFCLLYTSPSPRDGLLSRMPSSA